MSSLAMDLAVYVKSSSSSSSSFSSILSTASASDLDLLPAYSVDRSLMMQVIQMSANNVHYFKVKSATFFFFHYFSN